MLARHRVPPQFAAWNAQWHAPYGPRWGERVAPWRKLYPFVARRLGPFAYQPNNSTRTLEYPWAFLREPIEPGMTIMEIGGGLSGFQFALARSGAKVVNVDPLIDYGHELGYPGDPELTHRRLNRAFRTQVSLERRSVADLPYSDGSFDRAYSISTLEHLPEPELRRTVQATRRLLKDNALLILTVDLFLNLAPFTGRTANEWGTNISIAELVRAAEMTLADGDPAELCGFPEFSAERVLANLDKYYIGQHYPTLIQMLVLRKTSGRGGRDCVE